MGRIHRIGQDRKVFYYNFILSDTIDGYILDKLLKKMESIRNAIGDKIYDVIGKLVTEEEFAGLYEELLILPKEKWEAKVKRIDGIIEEKKGYWMRLTKNCFLVIGLIEANLKISKEMFRMLAIRTMK